MAYSIKSQNSEQFINPSWKLFCQQQQYGHIKIKQPGKSNEIKKIYKLSIFIVAYVLECRIRGEIV
jgi:hypothetical protein